jgi:hypothetical protein
VCHAVRAPGSNVTECARSTEGGTPTAISSSQTVPVNQSFDPRWVVLEALRLTCIGCLLLGIEHLNESLVVATEQIERNERCRITGGGIVEMSDARITRLKERVTRSQMLNGLTLDLKADRALRYITYDRSWMSV